MLLSLLAKDFLFKEDKKMRNLRLNVRQIALMGMLVSLSMVFDAVFKFYQLANGGSINLAMVGLVLIALSFSWWQSWLAIAVIFGGLTAFLDGYINFYVFDYFLALSGFVVISWFRKKILLTQELTGFFTLTWTFIIAFLWRFMMHVISGVLYFDVDWAGSFLYNLSYLLPSFFLSYAIILTLFFSSLPQIIRQFTLKRML
jgi:thiamine transporter ThiT